MAKHDKNGPPPPSDGSGSAPQPSPPDEIAAAFASVDWNPERDLACDNEKRPYKTLNNTLAVLTRHPEWRGVIAYDEFSGRIMKRRAPPFAVKDSGEWTDFDDVRAISWIAKHCRFEPKRQTLTDAVLLAADHLRYHEVREYLDSLKWDKRSRLNLWLIEYLDAGEHFEASDSEEDKKRKELTNQYVMAVGRMWLLAAVARIYRPGCKADNVIILEGQQWIGKSSTFAVLGGEWFTDATIRIGDKDALQLIRGKWIVELPELDSLNKSEASAIKAFFSVSVDRYRQSYGRRPMDVPRQCVFAGTVNHETYLKDDTGNRRFWPVFCRGANLEALRNDRDQLWAEAVALFKAGESWEPAPAQRELFEQEQEARYVGDAWEPVVKRWLTRETSNVRVTMTELLTEAIKIDRTKWTRQETARVGSIMRRLGWRRKREPGGEREWYYLRPDHKGEIVRLGVAVPAVPPSSHRGGTDNPF